MFVLSHNFKTINLHGKWWDRITCNNEHCPAFPFTLRPVKDLRPKEEADGRS